MGSVFKRPLSILSSRPKHCFKQWITGLSPHRARSPGGERVSPKVVRIGVGRQVRWQDLQSGRKSSGATWSRSASTMAELGVGPQVRWRDLESGYKSGGETCGQTGGGARERPANPSLKRCFGLELKMLNGRLKTLPRSI